MKLTIHTTAGNKRRELTAQILQSSLRDVGIDLEIITEKAGDLFGKRLPAGDFQLALYAQVPPSDKPSLCDIFCSKGIPGPSNNNAGQNFTRTNSPDVDKALEALDVETDDAKRKQLSNDAQNAIAADVTSLPVDPFPDIVAYNPAKVGGPVGHNLAFGPWHNMHEWFLKSSPTQTEATKGGELVFGAEQEADCADWIGSCAGASWGIWALGAHTMPRSFDFTADGHKPSELLAGEPTLELAGGKQIVTYRLNPAAKWSDGRRITSADYQYTWDQVKNGKDIYDTTGYRDIEAVDATDPGTAKVTFSKPFGEWRDLFGGFYGVFPKHLLEGKDRNAEMKDGYKFSGGPWVLDHWTKGTELVLTPNPNWYGAKKANLSKVTFKFTTDTSAEISNFKSKQLDAIYPQAQPEMKDLLTVPDLKVDVVTSLNFEGIWMNNAKPPLNDPKVREAIMYAVDREAIVTGLFRPIQPDIKVINAFMTPANKKFYGAEPFAKYKYDKKKAADLLGDAGWKKGSDGIFEKKS
jgi:ABC-type transport system substrate-binding protein